MAKRNKAVADTDTLLLLSNPGYSYGEKSQRLLMIMQDQGSKTSIRGLCQGRVPHCPHWGRTAAVFRRNRYQIHMGGNDLLADTEMLDV